MIGVVTISESYIFIIIHVCEKKVAGFDIVFIIEASNFCLPKCYVNYLKHVSQLTLSFDTLLMNILKADSANNSSLRASK